MRYLNLLTLLLCLCLVVPNPGWAHTSIPDEHVDSPLKKKKKKKKKKKFKPFKAVKKTVKKAGKKVKKAAKKTTKVVKKAAKKTVKVVKKAAKKTVKVVKKAAKKVVKVVKKAVKAVIGGVKGMAKCQTAAKFVNAVWGATDPATRAAAAAAMGASTYGAGAVVMAAAEGTDKGIKAWNAIVGKGSKWKIGPRRIKFNKWQDGAVITSRVMLAAKPTFGKIKIQFEYLGGAGSMSVAICKGLYKLPPKKIRGFKVGPGTKKGTKKTFEINTKFHVISVVMHSKKVPTPPTRVKLKMKVSGSGKFIAP
jgi:hypothetical protein